MNIIPDMSVSPSEAKKLAKLLTLINTKIAGLAQVTWEMVAYGSGYDCRQRVSDLLAYRDIITWKMNGCGCYKDTSLKSLISKIKQLTA